MPGVLPITVIVPTYNDGDYLAQALESVLAQTAPPARLAVIDDGSENTKARDIVDGLASKEQRTDIVYRWQENAGPSSARNRGLSLVDTPFVAFLDSDDRMLPDCLEKMHAALSALDESYFGVYGTHLHSVTRRAFPYGDHDGNVSASLIGHKGGIAGGMPSYLLRTECLTAIDGFDEALVNHEDFDVLIRLLQQGKQCRGKVTACFVRHYRPGSISRPADPYVAYRHAMQFVAKAERHAYFSAREIASKKRGVKLSLAKSLQTNGRSREALDVLREALDRFPRSRREAYYWYVYLARRLRTRSD